MARRSTRLWLHDHINCRGLTDIDAFVPIDPVAPPVASAFELARRAAEVDPNMKIVFITGFAAVALNAANQAPAKAKVLSKPFHLRELVAEVEKVMAA